ncbi:MAG: class I SAM-dependent DNA methyltransferase, partial [Calditrichia bacterium]
MISETTFNSTITSTPPYSKLAIVFDEMMTNVNYRRWAKYILTILKKENFRKGNLLDIGCGTGQLLSRLSKTRYNLEGCDSSPEMLAVARKKLPDIHFYEVSLPALDEIPSGK